MSYRIALLAALLLVAQSSDYERQVSTHSGQSLAIPRTAWSDPKPPLGGIGAMPAGLCPIPDLGPAGTVGQRWVDFCRSRFVRPVISMASTQSFE
jgi:hypothetical protein